MGESGQKIKLAYQEGGIAHLLRKAASAISRRFKSLSLNLYLSLRPPEYFLFRGERLSYLRHAYNQAFENERTVEVPIIWDILKKSGAARILEIGNVLRNYHPEARHDVLDKYEKGKGVINEDVEQFRPGQKYDLIVSISTMEHVGWDEEPRTPEKVISAFRNLKENCLAAKGKIAFTVPLGYNQALDEFLRTGRLSFPMMFFMKRISADNKWKEVPAEEIWDVAYDHPFPSANAILIGIDEKG